MSGDRFLALRGEWIYFIAPESLSAIKIGKVTSEKMYAQRFKQLQAMNHERLVCLAVLAPGNHESEHGLHERFAEHRLHGEWFATSQRIVTYALMFRDAKVDRHIRGLGEWMIPHDLLIGLERIYRQGCRGHNIT